MRSRILRWVWNEIITDVMIVADVSLGFLTWVLVLGLIPDDKVHFNVVGSVVLILVCSVPWWVLDRKLKRRLGY